MSALASLMYWLGDMSRTDELYSEALAIYRQLGDEARVTETIEATAWAAVGRGDYEVGMSRAQEALAAVPQRP